MEWEGPGRRDTAALNGHGHAGESGGLTRKKRAVAFVGDVQDRPRWKNRRRYIAKETRGGQRKQREQTNEAAAWAGVAERDEEARERTHGKREGGG